MKRFLVRIWLQPITQIVEAENKDEAVSEVTLQNAIDEEEIYQIETRLAPEEDDDELDEDMPAELHA